MQYTPEKLNEELHLAAMSFCGEDANVYINDETREIGFSKLLYWYMSDFGECIIILDSNLPCDVCETKKMNDCVSV